MTSRTLCIWIVTLIIMAGSLSVALKCENIHLCTGCSTTSIRCTGFSNRDMRDIFVPALPPYTQTFEYEGVTDVDLGEANFTHLTELKVLIISKTDQFKEVTISPIPSSAQRIFDPLKKLQILRINTKWYFEHPLDDLFRSLVHLEELDLSQTKRLNITNLQRAMYGFSNSTALKTIKLFNIQTVEHSAYSMFNLTWFLEPVKNCPIQRLYLAYNAFKAIFPGIIQYAPCLEYIDVSHNLLEPLVTSAFFVETLLHNRLQKTNFSYQGLGYHDDSTPRIHPDRSRKSLGTGTLQQRVAALMPDDFTPKVWEKCISTTIQRTLLRFHSKMY